MNATYKIGYYDETYNGRVWQELCRKSFAHDTQAEAEIDSLYHNTPRDLDGNKRLGLYVRRGSCEWFCRFSAHAG